MRDSKIGKMMAAHPQQKVRIPETTIASAAVNNPKTTVHTLEYHDSLEKPSSASRRQRNLND